MKPNRKSRKAFNAVLAVLIAVVLWLYVVNVENPTGESHLRNLDIDIQGEDVLEQNGLMVTDLSRDTMNLKVTGKKKTLMKLTKKNVSLAVDVSTITEEGDWTLNCKAVLPTNVTSESVSVSDWSSLKVTVTVAKRTSKEIPVKGQFAGKEKSGYLAGTVTTDPTKLEISGPESQVNDVAYALARVGGNDVSDSLSQDVPIVLMKADDTPANAEHMKCSTASVHVTVPVKQVVSIPLKVDLVDGGGADSSHVTTAITPESVTVVADGQTNLPESISLGQINLAQVFGSASYSFPIPIPEGATSWGVPQRASVTVTVNNLTTKQLDVGNISLRNAPSTYRISLVNPTLQVWVRGEQSVVDNLTADQIYVEADLTGIFLKPGLQRIPVNVVLSEQTGAGIVGTGYCVTVRVDK